MATRGKLKQYIDGIPDERVRNALNEIANQSLTVDDIIGLLTNGVTFSKINDAGEPEGDEQVLQANFNEGFVADLRKRRLPWEV